MANRRTFEDINAMGDCVATCQRASYALEGIAKAARRMGMHDLSDELLHIAKDIVEAAKEAQGAQGKRLNDDLKESNDAIGRTLLALIGKEA